MKNVFQVQKKVFSFGPFNLSLTRYPRSKRFVNKQFDFPFQVKEYLLQTDSLVDILPSKDLLISIQFLNGKDPKDFAKMDSTNNEGVTLIQNIHPRLLADSLMEQLHKSNTEYSHNQIMNR